jgi:hypothetical protein
MAYLVAYKWRIFTTYDKEMGRFRRWKWECGRGNKKEMVRGGGVGDGVTGRGGDMQMGREEDGGSRVMGVS